MKHKRKGVICLFAVVAGVFVSALCLRLALSGALEAYTDMVRTDAQTERIRPPLQGGDDGESFAPSGYEATPDPIFPGQESPGEEDPLGGGLFSGTNLYRVGLIASQEAEREILNVCDGRYEGWPQYIEKIYLECGNADIGYAWYGVVPMSDDIPVIVNRRGYGEIWTQRCAVEEVYAFLEDPTESTATEIKAVIDSYMDEWLQTGYVDW